MDSARRIRRATIVVRNPAMHDARVFREAETLRGLGYETEILAVVSGWWSNEGEAPGDYQGTRIRRLDPAGALRRFGPRLAAKPRGPARSAENGRVIARRMSLREVLRRLAHWAVTLNYYRLAFAALRARPPDLLHCNDYNTMWVGLAARLAFGTRVVYDSHELWPDRNGRDEPRAWLIAMEALFVRVADRCIATSPGHAAAIARRYRIAAPTVVRNVPAAIESPSQRPPRGIPTAVYVGGVMPQRGLEQLIAALPLVSELQLRIIGPGRADYQGALRELARSHGVAERVSFSAPVPPERVVDVVRDSHVGVALFQPSCRSYLLGLPNKLSEYALAGVPVVTSDLPIHAAFVRELGCGELVDPTDPVEIANALRRILLPERQRELRGNLARAPVRLNWARERAVLERVYREAAGDPEDDG